MCSCDNDLYERLEFLAAIVKKLIPTEKCPSCNGHGRVSGGDQCYTCKGLGWGEPYKEGDQ